MQSQLGKVPSSSSKSKSHRLGKSIPLADESKSYSIVSASCSGREPKYGSGCRPPLSYSVRSPFRRCSCAGVVQETCKNVSLVCESMQLSCPTVIRLCILLPLASSRLTLLVLRVELFPKSNFMPSPDGCASHNEWHDKAQQHRDGSKQEAVESIKRSIR